MGGWSEDTGVRPLHWCAFGACSQSSLPLLVIVAYIIYVHSDVEMSALPRRTEL